MAEEIYDIYVMVKETGAVIHASEEQWCHVKEVEAGRVWLYCFEEMKDQPSPDFDYDEPVFEVEKRNGRLQLTIREYSGRFHVDVFAFNQLIWRDVGGPERKHVGDSVIVEIPKVVVPPPPVPPPVPPPPVPPPTPPPAPPEWKPITDRLDKLIEKLQIIVVEEPFREVSILEIGPFRLEKGEKKFYKRIGGKGQLDFISVTFDHPTDVRLLIRRDEEAYYITEDFLRPNFLNDLIGLTDPDKVYCHIYDTVANSYGVTLSTPIPFKTEIQILFLNMDETTARLVKRGILIYTLLK